MVSRRDKDNISNEGSFPPTYPTISYAMDFPKQHRPFLLASNISPHLYRTLFEKQREVHRSWQDSVARISLRLRDWPRRSHPLLENKGQLSELGTLTWIFSWERKGFTVPLQLKAHLMYRRRSLLHLNWQIDGSIDMETRGSRGGSI